MLRMFAGRWAPFFLSLICVYGEIEVWNLDDIPLDTYEVAKNHPLQTLYRNDSHYLKIWRVGERNTINGRNNYFYHAVMSGYLDGIAPLKAVVVDHMGRCRGYATTICRPININFPKLRTHGLYSPSLTDDERLFAQLLSRMQKATLTHGVFFNDLSPTNMGVYDGECLFFDLDGIWKWEAYKEKFSGKSFYLSDKFFD